MMHQISIAMILHTYRDLSHEDLERYIAFMESPAGRWYNQTMMHAFLQTLASTSMNLGESIARELEQMRSRKAL